MDQVLGLDQVSIERRERHGPAGLFERCHGRRRRSGAAAALMKLGKHEVMGKSRVRPGMPSLFQVMWACHVMPLSKESGVHAKDPTVLRTGRRRCQASGCCLDCRSGDEQATVAKEVLVPTGHGSLVVKKVTAKQQQSAVGQIPRLPTGEHVYKHRRRHVEVSCCQHDWTHHVPGGAEEVFLMVAFFDGGHFGLWLRSRCLHHDLDRGCRCMPVHGHHIEA